MGWLRKLFRREKNNLTFVMDDKIYQAQVVSTVTPTPPTPTPTPKPVPEETDNSIDAVVNPEDYRWFKCVSCKNKIYSKNGDKMFRYITGDVYNRVTVKWCKNCVADVAFMMGCKCKDIGKAERRIIFKKLKGGKDER